jgi:predicted O-methyltransferase YrrM
MSRKYTKDWFDRCIPDWEQYLIEFRGRPDLHFLEIGSFEGRSTCWLLDNILTGPSSKITCVDLFEHCSFRGEWSKELYDRYDMPEVHRNFLENTAEYGDKVKCIVGASQVVLKSLIDEYDFIYIDGSHLASDVLEDAVLSFSLLKNHGTMILDDYSWEFFDHPLRHPKIAIDAFLEIYANRISVLHMGRQVILKKTREKEGFNEA